MNLIQELMNQAHTGGLLQTEHIKRFSPAEIREAIQTLVATEQLDLAFALGSAGMSILVQQHQQQKAQSSATAHGMRGRRRRGRRSRAQRHTA
jgi:hypothetical protein